MRRVFGGMSERRIKKRRDYESLVLFGAGPEGTLSRRYCRT